MVDSMERIKTWVKREWLPGLPGESVLDVGCANASYCPFFTRIKQMEYVGCDNDMDMLRRAREDNPDADIQYGALPDLPFADSSFDLVFCARLLHHFADQEPILRVLHRIARRYIVVHIRSHIADDTTTPICFRGTHYEVVRWNPLVQTRKMVAKLAAELGWNRHLKEIPIEEHIVAVGDYPGPDGEVTCVDPFYVMRL